MKLIRLKLATLLWLSLSVPVLAMNPAAMMKQEMEASAQRTCNDNSFLSCIGRSSSQCMKAAKTAIKKCESSFPKTQVQMNSSDSIFAHAKCMDDAITQSLGVSLDKLNQCDPAGAGDPAGMPPMSGSMPPMDANQGLEVMQKMMQQHARSVGTGAVTLPIYKNATVMSHIADDQNLDMMQHNMGVRPLPAMMLASTDSINTIAKFYRGKLKGFREYKLGKDILFMKNGPKNFDLARDFKQYATTPHVMISEINGAGPIALPGSRSQVEIAYKK